VTIKRLVADPLGSPSKTLLDYTDEILHAPSGLILDAGCGIGRNAVALAARGASIICLDRDYKRLHMLTKLTSDPRVAKVLSGALYPVCADVQSWPFPRNCFSAIVCVHLVVDNLLKSCRHSLIANGYLYLETFGSYGQNYLDLPRAKQFRTQLGDDFDFLLYRERKAGPPECDAVSVTLMARKKR
jgi:SAM-dependent methyltransferase